MKKKSSYKLKQYRKLKSKICPPGDSECGTRKQLDRTSRPRTKGRILDDAVLEAAEIKTEEQCASQEGMHAAKCVPETAEPGFSSYRLQRSRLTITSFGLLMILGIWLAAFAMPGGLTRYEAGDRYVYSDVPNTGGGSNTDDTDNDDHNDTPGQGNPNNSGAGQGSGTPGNRPNNGEEWSALPHDGPARFIAFTFDDGPNPTITPRLLDLLARHNIPATFFVMGSLTARHPQIVDRMAREGHEIGAHSWNHTSMGRMSSAQVINDINRTNAAIYDASGVYPTLLRPPYGALSATLRRTSTMPLILWSIDTRDWQNRNTNTIYNIVTREAQSGSIVLFHDIYHETLAAVERLIPTLMEAGFVFVTVSELLGHPLNPGQVYFGRL
ncbi:polysaccharide deacetylase family protein [Candidatus Saccharibacteria bacterium]|nr:polysaccharide deacetylase family protein [Candidatus Saccharibacteria bacterium]